MGGNAREMKSNFHRILDRRCVFYDNVVHRFVNETTFVGLPPSFVPRPRRKTVAEKWQKCLGRFPRTKLFHAFPLFFFGVEPRTTFVKLKIVSSIMRLFFFLLSPGSLLCRAVEGGGEKEKEGDTRQAGAFH